MQPSCLSVGSLRRLGRARRRFGLALLVPIALVAGSPAPAAAAASGYVPSGQPDGAGTVWLCRPGQANNPCNFPPQATVVPARGPRTVQNGSATTSSKFDCFYVYPTVSRQKSANANLKIQAGEVGAAISQASRFSSVCQVWAPMYTQRTAASLAQGLGAAPAADAVGLRERALGLEGLPRQRQRRPADRLHRALAGAAMLIRLLASQVDPNPALRTRTVVAILPGRQRHGARPARPSAPRSAHLPVCTSAGQTGLRHRLLDLSRAAAEELAVRAPRSRGQPAIGPDGRRRDCGLPASTRLPSAVGPPASTRTS